jgi:sugar/nucleoside kinase (ribokinase family)
MDRIGTSPRIVGLGNALVDVVASVDKEAIGRHGLTHGGMHLVEATAAEALYEEVGPGVRQSGGSVANSIAHIRAEGIACTYVGKVANDDLGAAFRMDFAELGIDFPAPPLENGIGTGRCVVLVTPDGERTMSTFLGAAQSLTAYDVVAAMPAEFGVLFVEGYLWDSPEGAAAIEAAAGRAKEAGARIALTPSDAGCVERNREAMLRFVREHCDILVGNHHEIGALAGNDDPVAALDWARGQADIAAVTMSEKGSMVAQGQEAHRIEPVAVPQVVDSTGAGDAYAAGLLAGIAAGRALPEAGRRGAQLAAEVITHRGARKSKAAA